MARAWIEGKPAPLERAVGEAAKLLAASYCPLIAGLGTDIAGARAAITLAERIGAAIDHMHSDALFRDLAVMRETGMMLTTPSEARLRADMLVLVGPGLQDAWTDFTQRSDNVAATPGIIWICPGRGAGSARGAAITTVGRDAGELPIVLAALRARIAGRPLGKTVVAAKALDDLVTRLKAARFGVAVWSAAHLDPLVIEMLCGIVADLNAETRFSGYPLAPDDNAIGVLQACGWMTGFPMRTGFGRGYPEHDPWRFDGGRMAATGEADCMLWVSAYRATMPTHDVHGPVIALTTGDAARSGSPAIQIEVGRPGTDHDGIAHHAALGTLASFAATQRSDAISVADAIERIVAALPGERAPP